MPHFQEKTTQFQQKKALFDIIIYLKRVFCLPFLHKISPFNMSKTTNSLSKCFLWYSKHLQFYKLSKTFNDHSFMQNLKKWFLAFIRTD